MNLVVNWRAVMLIPYAALRAAFLCCEKDEEIMSKLKLGFPACFGEAQGQLEPVPFQALIQTAIELQRQQGTMSPYLPSACEHLGLPVRRFVWLGGRAVRDEDEPLTLSVANILFGKPAGSTIELAGRAYVVVHSYLEDPYTDSAEEELADRSHLSATICPSDYLSAHPSR